MWAYKRILQYTVDKLAPSLMLVWYSILIAAPCHICSVLSPCVYGSRV